MTVKWKRKRRKERSKQRNKDMKHEERKMLKPTKQIISTKIKERKRKQTQGRREKMENLNKSKNKRLIQQDMYNGKEELPTEIKKITNWPQERMKESKLNTKERKKNN